MSKKNHKNTKGDTFEWEETDEVRKALERLHKDIREGINEIKLNRPNPRRNETTDS